MDIYFVTGNRHKVEEAEIALKDTEIKIHILDAKKIEPDDWKLEEVAAKNSKRIAEETGKTIIIEDTGVFFEGFEDFPGSRPKRWFDKLGYEGLLGKFNVGKKDEVKNRNAFFRTVIGYCEPGKEPILFSEEFHGKIAKEIKGINADVMPYERIFICGDGKFLFEYSREEKNKISHRAKAFKKFKEFLLSK